MGSARDEEREQRISMEIVVDAYGPEEQAMGWYMFVMIRWERGTLGVPLAQLEGIGVDERTRQVMEDWQYWVAHYEL